MKVDSTSSAGPQSSGRTIDRIDYSILKELSRDGRIPISDLAKRVGLSKSPCGVRVRRLVNAGYILGFRAVLDPAKLELEHIAFTEVKLRDTSEETLRAFNDAVHGVPEIEECHLIAGPFDYLLKVRTQDIRVFRTVLGEQISKLPCVAHTSTHISMEPVKEWEFFPLDRK